MKTAHKLILKSYIGPMILTFFIVMFVLIMQFLWRYIDEVVGKGLGMDVIAELLVYAGLSSIPMGLPLATLLAAIMTLGNMGEYYELQALKSAGLSLPRILKPLIVLIAVVSIGSYFIADRVVPYSYKKMFSLIFDIRQQQHTMEFKDGVFFNGFPDMSIRVGHQDDKTSLLTDILIYDTRDINGKMTTTVADSGYISMSPDRKYILATLYNGETYDEDRTMKWYENSALRHTMFDAQNMVIAIEGFDFERTDESRFSTNSQTKTTKELYVGIDSLELLNCQNIQDVFDPVIKTSLFPRDTLFLTRPKEIAQLARAGKKEYAVMDSISALSINNLERVYERAAQIALNSTYNRDDKGTLNQLYKFKVEWHRKWSLPVSIMIFFLIGAPLGAIIRKGGLGMPIVVSVSFFVIYYIISLTGEKMAKEGTLDASIGMWLSTFILLPIAIYLTYKATNDSNLFNMDWYRHKFKKLSDYFKSKIWWKRTVS